MEQFRPIATQKESPTGDTIQVPHSVRTVQTQHANTDERLPTTGKMSPCEESAASSPFRTPLPEEHGSTRGR